MKLIKISQLVIVWCITAFLSSCTVKKSSDVNNDVYNGTNSEIVLKLIPRETADTKVYSVSEAETKLRQIIPGKVALHYPQILAGIYAKNGMSTLWRDASAINEFERQLAGLALAGIHPQFANWGQWLSEPNLSAEARDIILSDAMVGYLHYVSSLSSNGIRFLYGKDYYVLASPNDVTINRWVTTFTNGQSKAFVQSLAPGNKNYAIMNNALKAITVDSKNPWPILTFNADIKVGNKISDSDLTALKQILHRLGAIYNGQVPTLLTANSGAGITYYDQNLAQQVKELQRRHGLIDNGVINSETKNLLIMSPSRRAALVALNMQRMRLLPDSNATAIIVNIPEYNLRYYVAGKEILTSRVIVGRVDRKTPLMINEVNSVVLNPPWNVPVSIAGKDILPKVKNDPSYLKRHGYTVYAGWTNSEPVDPSTVNWSKASSNSYHFKQAAGSQSALGRYKFNMPNSKSIYLHDTPTRNLFNQNMRAISSGCIRVQEAATLANLLLEHMGWSKERIEAGVQKGKTIYISLQERPAVYLYYLTAWSHDGKSLHFANDIYSYDASLSAGQQNFPQVSKLLL